MRKKMTYTLGFKKPHWKNRYYYFGLWGDFLIFSMSILSSVNITDFEILPEYTLEEFINANT